MKLTLKETKERLHKMSENSLKKREAHGVEGENLEFITLVNALVYLEKIN